MFKKGMKPHNKGDDYVHANYRNRPRMDRDDSMERKMQSSNPFRVDIDMRSLAMSKNHLKSDRVDLF